MPESLGKILKKKRESKQLSLEAVSEKTHISKKILQIIEEDRLHEISSGFYARGFVKSYVRFLGATEEEAVKAYFSGSQKKEEPALLLDGEKVPGDWYLKHKRHLTTAILAVFGICILFIGFIQTGKLVRHASEKIRIHVAKRKESKSVARAAVDKTSPVATDTERKEGVALEIKASYNTWIQVVSDGELLFRGILERGTKDIWQAKKEIKLELGNAGGVVLKLNGKNLGSPGRKGEKKEIVITKDGIR